MARTGVRLRAKFGEAKHGTRAAKIMIKMHTQHNQPSTINHVPFSDLKGASLPQSARPPAPSSPRPPPRATPAPVLHASLGLIALLA
eukprot:scaffold17683_cov69-Phaeocystis_antarctica.AAC.1